jgi:16S rRNA (guanine966-N2)-methyltransferase
VRIISGSRKGKRLSAPPSLPVRPTTDFAKEALFNILINHFYFEECSVLDLFAGTGNISYEFASRGASDILAIDNNDLCIKYIIQTAALLEFHRLKTIKADALQFLSKTSNSWDIIFSDPPFTFEKTEQIPLLVMDNKLLRPGGKLIVEHPTSLSFSDHPHLSDFRKYGSVCFSIFSDNPVV